MIGGEPNRAAQNLPEILREAPFTEIGHNA
jgi:hypothetical protein